MSERVFNFSAGPATLPVPVLERLRDSILDLGGIGIGVCEISHRSAEYTKINEEAQARLRRLLGAGDEWAVLFLQGGASLQFSMVPMNLGADADYVLTGSWSEKALAEAKKLGSPRVAASSEETGFDRIPTELDLSPDARFVHFTSNNTIFGTEFPSEPETPEGGVLICDASSDIFSRRIDVSKYGMIYAGAQKNLGPAGVTLVIIRDDLVEQGDDALPTMLQYRTWSENKSLFNTPPSFGIYLLGKVCQWILRQGGLSAMEERNAAKAGRLYDFLDSSSLFKPTTNVTFVTGDADADAEFIAKANSAGMDGLKGHRSVGGMRASIYNAFPPEGVDTLISFMKDFEAGR